MQSKSLIDKEGFLKVLSNKSKIELKKGEDVAFELAKRRMKCSLRLGMK